jgi:hypothetical protein
MRSAFWSMSQWNFFAQLECSTKARRRQQGRHQGQELVAE